MLGRHLSALVRAMRPRHWLKNGFVLAPAVFAGHALDPAAMAKAVTVAAAFCLVSSAGYLVNDVLDRESDRKDPAKRLRPVASGAMSVAAALAWSAVLYAVAFAAAAGSGRNVVLLLAGYVGLSLLYSLFLKAVAVVDAMALATLFLVRLVAGAVAIPVSISHWLLVCTILLALFLALSKRRHELVMLANGATEHRRILGEYSPYLLDQMIGVVTASTLIAYIFYTISPETQQKFQTEWLGLTIPFPLYGIFRYLYLVH